MVAKVESQEPEVCLEEENQKPEVRLDWLEWRQKKVVRVVALALVDCRLPEMNLDGMVGNWK